MENQHQKISGYRDLSAYEIDQINYIKGLEREVASYWRLMVDPNQDTDKRQLALAKTKFEEAFMHFVKAVAKPDSVW